MADSSVKKRRRRSVRLRNYDYAQAGAYFVTICTYDRQSLFGEIVDDWMNLNTNGHVVEAEWIASARIRQSVELDAFVVMPNHIHGILVLCDVGATRCVARPNERDRGSEGTGAREGDAARRPYDERDGAVGATRCVARPGERDSGERSTHRVAPTGPACGSVGAIIGQVKSQVTKRINALRNTPGARVWQRGYYEHVIRNEDELRRAREYIANNPARWALDRENPEWAPRS